MRKRRITPIPQDAPTLDEGWLDLDREAVVEVTSKEKEFPVEGALVAGELRGWRAAVGRSNRSANLRQPSKNAHALRSPSKEPKTKRTQEFVLRWSPDSGVCGCLDSGN
ncbi:MAG: hypothetical protein ABSD75_22985 [Terriglobales bacterium]|jgi:hypothetical protein